MFIVERVNVFVALVKDDTGSNLFLLMYRYSQSFDWRNIQKIRLHFALSFHGGHAEQLHSKIVKTVSTASKSSTHIARVDDFYNSKSKISRSGLKN